MAAAKINDTTQVALPIRNLISLIAAAAISTYAYFQVIEHLNKIETNQHLMQNDLNMNTEFRIKWPRGEMGNLPADSEQFMLIEHLTGELEKLTKEIESGQAPFDQQQKLTLDFYEKRIANLEAQMEKLKDSQMEMYHKSNGAKGDGH